MNRQKNGEKDLPKYCAPVVRSADVPGALCQSTERMLCVLYCDLCGWDQILRRLANVNETEGPDENRSIPGDEARYG